MLLLHRMCDIYVENSKSMDLYSSLLVLELVRATKTLRRWLWKKFSLIVHFVGKLGCKTFHQTYIIYSIPMCKVNNFLSPCCLIFPTLGQNYTYLTVLSANKFHLTPTLIKWKQTLVMESLKYSIYGLCTDFAW